jgi:predicted small lipoprotein YifL
MVIKNTIIALLCVLVAGCGNMGPLYLPKHEQDAKQKTQEKTLQRK